MGDPETQATLGTLEIGLRKLSKNILWNRNT